MNVLAARDTTVLDDGFDSENLPLPLNLTAEAADSRMFGQSKALLNILGTEAVTMNNHMSGVTPAAFAGNARLTSMFNILSTNVDRKNREFVSTIEGGLGHAAWTCPLSTSAEILSPSPLWPSSLSL